MTSATTPEMLNAGSPLRDIPDIAAPPIAVVDNSLDFRFTIHGYDVDQQAVSLGSMSDVEFC